MIRLDLLGTSCVGKSWFLRHITHNNKSRKYLSDTTAIEKSLRKRGGINRLILSSLPYPRKASIKKLIIEKEFQRAAYTQVALNELPTLSQVMIHGFSQKNHPAKWKLRIYPRIVQLIKSCHLLKTALPYDHSVVLCDEAFCNHLPLSLFDEFFASHEPTHFLYPDGVIHFTASDDVIVSRIQLRNKSGCCAFFDGLSSESLRLRIREMKRLNALKADKLRAFGIPVLDLKSDIPLDSMENQFLEFVSGISQ